MAQKVTTEFRKGQARIFQNPFLESLTKTNLTQNIVVYGLTIASISAYAIIEKEISILMIGIRIILINPINFLWNV